MNLGFVESCDIPCPEAVTVLLPVGGLPATSSHHRGGDTAPYVPIPSEVHRVGLHDGISHADMNSGSTDPRRRQADCMIEPSGPPHERSATRMRRWCAHASMRHMPRLVPINAHFFPQWSALRTERHLTRLWVHWVTVTYHWQEVAWREKGRHLADETTALRILQLKRRRSLSPDARSGKCQKRLP